MHIQFHDCNPIHWSAYLHKCDASKYHKPSQLIYVIITYNKVCTTVKLSPGIVAAFEMPLSPEMNFFTPVVYYFCWPLPSNASLELVIVVSATYFAKYYAITYIPAVATRLCAIRKENFHSTVYTQQNRMKQNMCKIHLIFASVWYMNDLIFFCLSCITSMLNSSFHRWMYAYMICLWFSEPDMPDHDLEPPRFSRRALERLLNDWPAVHGMIMSGKWWFM